LRAASHFFPVYIFGLR